MSNFDETLMKRLTKLEREVERLRVKERPVGGGGGVTDHGALGGLSDNDHPQYLLTTGKAADADKLDNIDSTEFVQTSGNQSVGGTKTFSSIPVLPASNPTTANQAVRKGYADGAYLGITAKAADADKLDGLDSTGFATAGHDHNAAYLGITAKAADSDKLDGIDSTGFATAGHDHNAAYLGITAKAAADSDKLDGLDSTAFLQVPTFSTTAPTPTASSGTFTTVSCAVKAITIGKLRIISGLVYIGNAGTASGTLRVPYPSGDPASIGGGRWAGAGYSGDNVNCIVSLLPSNAYLEILKYDGTTAIGTGASISFSISYELS